MFLKQPTLGAYLASLIFQVGSTREFFPILEGSVEVISNRFPFSIMSVLYWLVLSYGRVSGSIVYTEQRGRIMEQL